MRTTREIAAIAKDEVRGQFGACVRIALAYEGIVFACLLVTRAVPVMGTGAMFLLSFFIPVLYVGMAYASLQVYSGQTTEFASLFYGMRSFGRNLGSMLLVSVFTFLWMLLLIVPGIVKYFSYSMTPYILADSRNLSARNAIKLSMRITKGHKEKIFLMVLRWAGWAILCQIPYIIGFAYSITNPGTVRADAIFILGMFLGNLALCFLLPYMLSSMAGLYLELKQEGLHNGTASPEEFS